MTHATQLAAEAAFRALQDLETSNGAGETAGVINLAARYLVHALEGNSVGTRGFDIESCLETAAGYIADARAELAAKREVARKAARIAELKAELATMED